MEETQRMDVTSLPLTCGEVMEIPGTPSIGCVAIVQYDMNSAAGFSSCVVASQEEVYILGPNLKTGDSSLTSVRLWRPHTEARATRMISLVAFLLHPQSNGPSGVYLKNKDAAVADEMCAVVAWEDAGGLQQHITALFFSLLRVLSGDGNVSVVVRETSFCQARGQQRVLRLFYHPLLSVEASKGNHVVLCSCYNESVRKNALLTLSEDCNPHILTAGDPRGVLSGSFSFVVDIALPNEACGRNVEWTTKSPTYIAPWLLGCSCDGLICAFAVQPEPSFVIAAFGTTNGRLILFRNDGTSVTHRLGGPIADLAFVDTQPIKGDEHYRNSVITELLQKQQKTVFCSLSAETEASTIEKTWMSLVVLDSLGRVIVFRDVGLETVNIQGVPDVQQLITLAGHRTPHTNNANSSCGTEEAEGTRPAAVSPKNFFDLSSLRLFFQRRKQKESGSELPHNKSGQTFTHDTDVFRQLTREDAKFAGHILSRGLLSLVSVPGPRGYVELVVSTMGQSIVSIPYDPSEKVFSIAGFIEAPEPMFFLGFVDFFNTGVTELVMAGKQHVLVAKRSRCQQKFRSNLLLRLLAGKGMQNVAPDVDVDSA